MGLSAAEMTNQHNNQHQHPDGGPTQVIKQESLTSAVDEAMEFLKTNGSTIDEEEDVTNEEEYDDEFDDDFSDIQLPPDQNDTYDPDAEHTQTENGPEEVFRELKFSILNAFEHEKEAAAKRGEKLPLKELKLKDLNFQNETFCSNKSAPSMYELVDAWKTLVDTLLEHGVFMEHVLHLEEALHHTADVVEAKAKGYPLITEDEGIRRHILTLVILLGRSVEQFSRDKSIECRFVTLLEIILTYCPDWSPSEEVTRFWVRLMQRIPHDIPAVNFRRRAYRVLVSLAWVPSSQGLLEACSFEQQKQTIDFESAEPPVQAHMGRIRGGQPLPRYDCVNQLLDRLKDETDVCVAITSERGGMGKTTLAGQVASHPSIQRVFTVLWLKIENDGMLTYETYTKYLDLLCAQLPYFKKAKQKVNWPKYIKRFEEPALRRLREQDCIAQAKHRMSEILERNDRNVLLVLDNVLDQTLIEWFRFHDRQSLIVTTPLVDLDAVDWTVELGPLSEEESIVLFLLEANLPTDHILGCTSEMREIVEKTECIPLVIRTVARWFQLKQVTAGIVAAIEEVVSELETLAVEHGLEEDEEEDPNQLLFDVLSLMMGPVLIEGNVMSPLFVLCFAALVCVFEEVCPLDSVLLLWDQILKIEPMAVDELKTKEEAVATDDERRRRAWFVAEGLIHMGLISVIEVNGNPWVHVHHQLYRQFAVLMASQMDLKKEKFEDNVADWHLAFVTSYFQKRVKCDKKDFDDNSWDYAIEKLPTHMFAGRMYPTAVAVLSEQTFFQARIEALGWDKAIEQHIEDCVNLQQGLEKKNQEAQLNALPASTVFSRASEMILEAVDDLPLPDTEVTIKESRALYQIGFALTENGYYEDAIEHFEDAQHLKPQSRSLSASILYSAGWALLANNDPERAKKKINASRKIMDQGADLHVLYKEMLQVYADALVATCNYMEAASFYEVMVDNMREDAESNPIELGTSLHKKGLLNYMMGDIELAKATLDECIRWKEELGEISRSLSSAYSVLGDIHMELENVTDAKKCFEAGLHALDQLECDSQQLDYRLMTGKLQFLKNDFGKAFKSFDLVKRTIKESPLMVLDQSAYDLRILARMYFARGDLDSSMLLLRESLQLTKDRTLSLERAWSLLELGTCLIDEGNYTEGLECYEQALAIQITQLGESMQVIDTSKLIGSVHLSLGEWDASLSVFIKIHQILERVAPDDVDKNAGVLFLIGEAYDGKGSHAEAKDAFDDCLEVLKKGRTGVHADVGKVCQRLGDAAAHLGDLDEAFDYYTEALRIRKMNFDERLRAETMHSLGILHRKRGDLTQAKKSLLDALEIRKNNRVNKESAETLLELANVYRLQGEPGNASKLLQKGLEVIDEDDVYKGCIHLTFGHLLFSQGEYAEAVTNYKKALKIREEAFGKDDLKTAKTYRSVGLASYIDGQTDLAFDNFNDFIRVCDLRGESCWETVDYVLATLLLGDIHEMDGKDDEANEMWTHAKEMLDDTETIRATMPELGPMIDRRLEGGGTRDGKLSSEEELAVKNILFIDD